MSASMNVTRGLELLLGDLNEPAWQIIGKYRKNVEQFQ